MRLVLASNNAKKLVELQALFAPLGKLNLLIFFVGVAGGCVFAGIPIAFGFGAISKVSYAGTLVGIEAPPPSRNLEVKPYAISKLTTDKTSRPTVNNKLDPDAGLASLARATAWSTMTATSFSAGRSATPSGSSENPESTASALSARDRIAGVLVSSRASV